MPDVKLKTMILRTLARDEQSRNSDIRLTQVIWYEYYRDFLFQDAEGKWCVRISNMFELAREDNIKRLRAKIQNEENKFLPTDPEVRKQRKINEEKWREYLGYNPEMRTV
jgi:hypothetical protein